ncbi:3698_t:CDS:2 [Funneliformis geosporum]|uniref:9168_t:CDS:1 n=1 Tax=Funneliformis geosporum TaxID=1117311 RepID=A0A9W4ST62_9GLOM|nr:9168_t:CDS:2 [Funneliformis geosporum]CAI2181747.1 3698_t:CDS:2 [Funneliformis geosporum]
MTFLLAGHETTSNGLSWALYSLAKNPHIQDLLREELVKAFPDKSKFNPTFDEINSLEYLNCIIKETLRLYPPVTVTLRSNIEDQVFGEHFIPKNTPIIIPFVALHRLPSIWGPTADEFVPKRWLDPPSIQGISNYNYLPFSTGLRSCIGSKLALNEIKILLSLLVRNFVFQTVEGFQIKKKVGFLSKVDPHLELIVTNVEA